MYCSAEGGGEGASRTGRRILIWICFLYQAACCYCSVFRKPDFGIVFSGCSLGNGEGNHRTGNFQRPEKEHDQRRGLTLIQGCWPSCFCITLYSLEMWGADADVRCSADGDQALTKLTPETWGTLRATVVVILICSLILKSKFKLCALRVSSLTNSAGCW